MTEQYTMSVASHYSAYRPPLHHGVLNKVLASTDRFTTGLDIGCGTGRSSIALASFCSQVYALDPSPSMLRAASQHESVIYLQGTGDALPLADRSIDIATLAGSLYYLCANTAVQELQRVCRNDALIIAYDFEILIDHLLERFDITSTSDRSGYDHRANFSEYGLFEEILVRQDRVAFDVRAADLAHIVLADQARHDRLVRRYQSTTPCKQFAAELGTDKESLLIEADLFYSVYRMKGNARQQ